jgi:hypothetical protein
MSSILRFARQISAFAVILSFFTIYPAIGVPALKAQEIKQTPGLFEKFNKADAVTNAVRDKSKDFVRVKVGGPNDAQKIAKLGKIVEDYGSFVIVAKNKTANLPAAGLEFQKLETTVNLPNGRFEPVYDKPAETVAPTAAATGGKNYFIVQFAGNVKDEWLDSLREIGVEILQYVPHQAFLVYADGETISKVANHSRVRWVGQFAAAHKLSPELNAFVSKVESETAMFDVAVFGRADLQEVRARIAGTIRGRVLTEMRLANNFFNIVRIEANKNDVAEIAKIPDVVRIDQYEKPRIEDERAAQIVAGNYTSPTALSPAGYNPLAQFGVDGTGVTVAVADDGISIPGNGGFYLTSTNTVDGPLRGAAAGATGGHGHLNASIIAGNIPFSSLDPTGYIYGIVIAPKANIINIPFLVTGNTTTDAQSFDDTLNTLGPNGVKGTISNNSWGNGLNSNSYDSYAAMYDGFVQDASLAATIDPMMIVFSAGNSGPGANSLTRPKVAKNVISVGNSENIRTEINATNADNLDDLRSSSSRGPAADGRVKPDIVAPGSYITGSRAGTGSSVSGQVDANVSYSIGTSHAAPQVAGAAALFTQFWKNNNAGANPSPALIKSAILNTAQEMNGNITTTSTIPNGNEGWGRIYLKNMFNTGVPIKYVNENETFSNPGEMVVYSGEVADSTKPFRVSLVWTDPPGTGNPALVNNLDLTVKIGANTYRGNVFSGGNSTTGGANSTIDNVENVFLPAGIPAGTPVTITIAATALNGNGILGNADTTDQHFALVGFNFTEQPVNTVRSPVDFDGDSKTDVSIFRPAVGEWWYLKSSTGGNAALQFGQSTDKLTPADYTGDGKTDIAFWRPSTGEWFILRSEDNSFLSFPFGTTGDKPFAGDFDGDGKADPGVFRSSTGEWFILKSTGGVIITTFGGGSDVPALGDYDGDGLTDIAIYRPGPGQWWIRRSSNASVYAFQFGTSTDKPVPGDYTGDGRTDSAFFRPSTGEWFIVRSEDSTFYSVPFGSVGDAPSPGDYDGDGRFDTAVFRPSTSTWFVNRSTAGSLITTFGAAGDVSVPNAFVP